MLRSFALQSEPPYLAKLVNEKKWESLKLYVKAHPEDAVPNLSINRGIGPSILSKAVRAGAPYDVLVALTEASIEQLILVKLHRQGTVLHEAIKCKASGKTILYFVDTIMKYEQKQVRASGRTATATAISGTGTSRGDSLRPTQINCYASSREMSAPLLDGSVQAETEKPYSYAVYHHATIFNQCDDLGRCPIHYLVERIAASKGKDRKDDGLMQAVQKLANVFPPAIGKKDADGLTSLDLALISSRSANGNGGNQMEIEMRIHRICSILVEAYDMAALSSANPAKAEVLTPQGSALRMRKSRAVALLNFLPEKSEHRYRMNIQRDTETARLSKVTRIRGILASSVDGSIEHNPLSRAVMNGRHVSTIELLMEASKFSHSSWHTGQLQEEEEIVKQNLYSDGLHLYQNQRQDRNCMSIVTRDFEVPMHIAVTMGASSDVVQLLLSSASKTAAIPDRCNLTPICWAWIRHVVGDDPIRASKRRFIPMVYVQKNDLYTSQLADSIIHRNPRQMKVKREEREVWKKLSKLLPAAAAAAYYEEQTRVGKRRSLQQLEGFETWSPLHAASFLDCPRAVILLALAACPDALKTKDKYGNLPLHYAASRYGYRRFLPCGPASTPLLTSEISPIFDLVHLYPDGTNIFNRNCQLPLHTAIETEKKLTAHMEMFNDNTELNRKSELRNGAFSIEKMMKTSVVLFLSKIATETLEAKDGPSGLFPFMQAASGGDSILNTVYGLLRECPSLAWNE